MINVKFTYDGWVTLEKDGKLIYGDHGFPSSIDSFFDLVKALGFDVDYSVDRADDVDDEEV